MNITKITTSLHNALRKPNGPVHLFDMMRGMHNG